MNFREPNADRQTKLGLNLADLLNLQASKVNIFQVNIIQQGIDSQER